MDRLACVDVPVLPLQLLLRSHPTWRNLPAGVVDREKAGGTLLFVNLEARRRGIQKGMRYTTAIALDGNLRAGVVSSALIAEQIETITLSLRRFTPDVEPCRKEPGVFWLNASKLQRVFPSLERWGLQIQRELRALGFRSSVVVGTNRFSTYALARHRAERVTVYESSVEEHRAARDVPLSILSVEASVRDQLEKLAVRKVGELIRLPSAGLRQVFGEEVHRLHELASQSISVPFQAEELREQLVLRSDFDLAETDSARLLFECKRLLVPLLSKLRSRCEALSALDLRFSFESKTTPASTTRIEPAAPTLDAVQLSDLIRLRLETMQFGAGVSWLEIDVFGQRVTKEQLNLFEGKPKRDKEAGHRALSRLRALFGDEAVVVATLRQAHLPLSRFQWTPIRHVKQADVCKAASRPLIRRVHAPCALHSSSERHADGWQLGDMAMGPVASVMGPYVIEGGWWLGDVAREYHFVETLRGDLLWVFYDRRRRRWFLQGRVE